MSLVAELPQSKSRLDFSSDERLCSVLADIQGQVKDDKYWHHRLQRVTQGNSDLASIHLGIFIEPFLGFILDGRKTIESRFSVNRQAPFGIARKNDIILLKESGGPIVAICRVEYAWHYHLDEQSWSEIKLMSQALCIQDPLFWQQKAHASYATLLKIDNVRSVTAIPFPKRDRRGWMVLHKADVS